MTVLKSQVFFIPGPLPGFNELMAAALKNRFVYNKLKRQWQDLIAYHLKAQRVQPVTEPIFISYLWVEPNKRRDLSNISSGGRKITEDSLVEAGILKNDGWRDIVGYRDDFTIDRLHPGVKVTLAAQESIVVGGNTPNAQNTLAYAGTRQRRPRRASPGTVRHSTKPASRSR